MMGKVKFVGADPFSLTSKCDLQGLKNIHLRCNLMLYQKFCNDNDHTWFLQGEGISGEIIVFSGEWNVIEVCLAANCIVGLSVKDNKVFRAKFHVNYDSEMLNHELSEIPPSPIVVKQIATNDESIFALDQDNGIYMVEEDAGLTLKWKLEGTNKIVQIDCGFAHFLALSDTGALYSWGSGGRGELGHIENEHVMVNCEKPKRIDFFDDLPSIVKKIGCGGWHNLALTSDGDVYSFGWNESGQLGYSQEELLTNNAIKGSPYPIDVGSADDPVTQIASGARHSVIILKSGKVYYFGSFIKDEKEGQLELPSRNDNDKESNLKKPAFILQSSSPLNVTSSRWATFIHTYD